jgi:hypothetical protein
MKIKVVVIDFEVPTRVKQWALRIGIPVVVLGGFVALAYANVPVAFNSGEVLQASDLNTNFQSLDQRLTAVEAAKATLVVDGNGVVLGRVLQAPTSLGPFSFQQYAVLTSTGYVVNFNGDGSSPTVALWFSGANCTGSAYALQGNAPGMQVQANFTIWNGAKGQYYAPANADASGLSTIVSSTFMSNGDSACNTGGAVNGLLMTPLTNAQVGLPATVASPLKVQ